MSNPALAAHPAADRQGRPLGLLRRRCHARHVNRLKELGGLHEEEDFAAQESNWVEPIHAAYRGYEVYECPPNGPGPGRADDPAHARRLRLGGETFSEADRLHLLAEATKAAYCVRDNFICDPDTSRSCRGLPVRGGAEATRRRSGSTGAARRSIGRTLGTATRSTSAPSTAMATHARSSTRCSPPSAPASWRRKAGSSCTIAAADSARSPGIPNAIAPGKRPFHTMIPGMLVKDGRAVMPFGVMGGQYQAVGHADFLHHLLDRGMDPQQAAGAAAHLRLQRRAAGRARRAEPVRADLAGRGHEIEMRRCRSAAARRSGSIVSAAS